MRLSGQDSERGTFSQRHAVLMDQVNEKKYTPLRHIAKGQGEFEVINSMLSEEAVLGFEYGYSLAEPNALVLWEAQFGDFANGAQVVVDQFISSGERKWLRMSGLVLLLPHGYEGQGPEHSSARLERYLQLCAEDNWQVANCTTPANYFHALRRQLHRQFRKPLVLMTPKSLLRNKRAMSRLEEFGPQSSFHRVLWDDAQLLANEPIKLVPDAEIKRVVLCSGKVYYDLYEEREKRGRTTSICCESIALPVPGPRPDPRIVTLPRCRDGFVPGGAEEYGCLELHRAQYRMGAGSHRRSPQACPLRRTAVFGSDGRRPDAETFA